MQSVTEAQRKLQIAQTSGESSQHAVMFNSHAVTVFSPGTGEEQRGVRLELPLSWICGRHEEGPWLSEQGTTDYEATRTMRTDGMMERKRERMWGVNRREIRNRENEENAVEQVTDGCSSSLWSLLEENVWYLAGESVSAAGGVDVSGRDGAGPLDPRLLRLTPDTQNTI